MADNDKQPETKIVSVTGKRCEPDTESWYEYKWKEQQETPRRLEDAAKFLSGTISICLALFLAVGKSALENLDGSSLWLGIAILLLLGALVTCLLVLFPWRYRFVECSIKDFKRTHVRIVRFKYMLLAASVIMFFLSLVILTVRFFG